MLAPSIRPAITRALRNPVLGANAAAPLTAPTGLAATFVQG